MQPPVTQRLCEGPYVQGKKQCLLLRAARGDHPLRGTVGRDHQGLLNPSQAFCQEFHPDAQVALLEPQPYDADQPQSYQAGEGRDRACARRPVSGWPPPSGPSTRADTEPLLDLRLAAGGSPHASGGKLLTVGTEDRRAQGLMRALAFVAPIPLPTPRLHLPLVHTQSKGKAVLE